MPYTLVSAATLGFDLVRIPAGRAVAGVLLGALHADEAALLRLADAHPARGLARDERFTLAARSRRARELAVAVPHVRGAARGAPAAGNRAAVLAEQLEQGTIGDAPTLERLLRDDVLGAEHPAAAPVGADLLAEAADVLADAAVGYWAAGVLPPLVRRELTASYDRVTDGVPPAGPECLELGAAGAELTGFLVALRSSDERARARWRTAVDDGRTERRPWATAMHEASWAAHVSGRTRVLATAQLHAVQAFLDGGFDRYDGAAGVWNAVAGCVQGIVMGDLVEAGALTVLRAPLARAH